MTNTSTALVPRGYAYFYADPTQTSLGKYLGYVYLNSSASATFTTTSLAVGSHQISAVFNVLGTGNFAKSTSPNMVGQTVVQDQTSLTLSAASSNTSPSIYGQSLFYLVSVSNTSNSLVPQGNVSFYADATQSSLGTLIGSAPLDGSGNVTFTTTAVPVGSHQITAVFNVPGTGYFATSTSTNMIPQTVTQATTTTLAAGSGNPSSAPFGQSLTYTATVTNISTGVTPKGSVSFYMDPTQSSLGTLLGAATLNSAGNATITITGMPPGNHQIGADFNVLGTGNFASSTSQTTIPQTVTQAQTAMTFSADAANPSSAVYGQSLIYHVTVTNKSSAVIPKGVGVSFFADATQTSLGTFLGDTVLDGTGKATFTTTTMPVGVHEITAIFNEPGTSNFAESTSPNTIAQTVTQAQTALALSAAVSNPPSPTVGQALSFLAAVTNTSTGATPKGYVYFYADATQTSLGKYLGYVILDANGNATLTTTSLTAGNHAITAIFNKGGTGNFATSTSPNPVSQTVGNE